MSAGSRSISASDGGAGQGSAATNGYGVGGAGGDGGAAALQSCPAYTVGSGGNGGSWEGWRSNTRDGGGAGADVPQETPSCPTNSGNGCVTLTYRS
ncbi:hypothetical protein GCM10010317_008770 [Streptomyces mirabilis]|nr:hypothetical protein GCM10010317_008770 [Streptomyces mirabilis]